MTKVVTAAASDVADAAVVGTSTLQVLGKVLLPFGVTLTTESVDSTADLFRFVPFLSDFGFRPRFLGVAEVTEDDAAVFGAVDDVAAFLESGDESATTSPPAELPEESSRVNEDERLCFAADPICKVT